MKKYFSLAKSILLSNFDCLAAPYKLTFIVTYKCNFACSMCDIWREKDFSNEMSLDEIEQFFSLNNFLSWLNISGGEIFLRKDIQDIFDIITSKCSNLYLLDFPTNGFLTDAVLSTTENILSKYSSKLMITISLDGYKELHEEIRKKKDCWTNAIRTFRELREIKSRNLHVFFGMTLSGLNYGHFDKTLTAVRQEIPNISVNDFHFNLAHQSGSYYKNTDFEIGPLEQIGNEVTRLSQMRKFPYGPVAWLEKKYLKNIGVYIEKKKIPLNCKAMVSSCFIDPYWNIFACSMDKLRVGNLRESEFNLKRIWKSPAAKSIRKLIAEKKCAHCWTPCEAYQTILGNLI